MHQADAKWGQGFLHPGKVLGDGLEANTLLHARIHDISLAARGQLVANK